MIKANMLNGNRKIDMKLLKPLADKFHCNGVFTQIVTKANTAKKTCIATTTHKTFRLRKLSFGSKYLDNTQNLQIIVVT
ncbi:TPA: hypothetical protein I7692_22200 [Vibrio vulnificus]|nr:hypothetical protein [Vibrio vulnificus]